MQDISPLPEAGAELAIEPTEPLALPRPSAWNRKWTAAIVVSCALHAAVAAAFLISPSGISSSQNAEQPEGSDQSGTNVVGSALDKDPTAINVALVPSPQPAVAVPEQPPIPSARPSPPAASSKTADEKRGTADGQDLSAQAASKGKRQNEAGTAAEDNYRGDVFRKLGSVNRTLPPSLQLAARNNAVVKFVIGRKGNINKLRILETSGSAAFDQAALGIIRKAAPFPSIPPQAASASLEFETEIGPF
ncbi:energy transducer TonB [Mesorhizobium sp. M7A.F.Ca.US.001.04.1.1]|nr:MULTISPECIES: TonB family protein [unclassified Mesorhizobium]RUX70237.1 energy transducer TonB [Mesorhizobium sp. M7A.F.Ca.US.005.03.1.1]RUY23618.1 energy transducer TonB [Mesorhizobium sp. M7A.F.Ca.US.001.04.2.1]RUY38700.1 energy transducer TonB [Mesorhizobium sp. M7A.F.Ca.US.001.04.1.1]